MGGSRRDRPARPSRARANPDRRRRRPGRTRDGPPAVTDSGGRAWRPRAEQPSLTAAARRERDADAEPEALSGPSPKPIRWWQRARQVPCVASARRDRALGAQQAQLRNVGLHGRRRADERLRPRRAHRHGRARLQQRRAAVGVQDLFVTPLWMALVWVVHALVVMLEWCFTLDLLDSPPSPLGLAALAAPGAGSVHRAAAGDRHRDRRRAGRLPRPRAPARRPDARGRRCWCSR